MSEPSSLGKLICTSTADRMKKPRFAQTASASIVIRGAGLSDQADLLRLIRAYYTFDRFASGVRWEIAGARAGAGTIAGSVELQDGGMVDQAVDGLIGFTRAAKFLKNAKVTYKSL
jgi:hypothetical protein